MALPRWLAIAALVGCGPARRPAGIENAPITDASAVIVPGVYTCAIREGDYDYQPFRCEVRARDGRTWLAKVEGSVQLGGEVRPARGGGFRFVGVRFCPWGDCTERVSSEFAPTGDGYRGTIVSQQSGPSQVTLRFARPFDDHERDDPRIVDALEGAGGAGYGGFTYGFPGYGPDGLGAASYGGDDRYPIQIDDP